MKHGRQVKTPNKHHATPWKYLHKGRPIRRGAFYMVRLLEDGKLLWEGEVQG